MIEFLYRAAKPPPLKKTDRRTLENGRCAFSGERIVEGYPLKAVISTATAEISDTFRYPSEFVSAYFAELFRAQALLRGNLLFLQDALLQPMISATSAATQSRPCWRDLVMGDLPIESTTLAVVTDESKRRLWTHARTSVFGDYWRPFLNASVVKAGKTYKAPLVSRSLVVNVFRLRECLKTVEAVQSHGFTKRGIYEGILDETERLRLSGCDVLSNWRTNSASGGIPMNSCSPSLSRKGRLLKKNQYRNRNNSACSEGYKQC